MRRDVAMPMRRTERMAAMMKMMKMVMMQRMMVVMMCPCSVEHLRWLRETGCKIINMQTCSSWEVVKPRKRMGNGQVCCFEGVEVTSESCIKGRSKPLGWGGEGPWEWASRGGGTARGPGAEAV